LASDKTTVQGLRPRRSCFGHPRAGVAQLNHDALQGGAVLGLLLGDDGSVRSVVLCSGTRTWCWGDVDEVGKPRAWTPLTSFTEVTIYDALPRGVSVPLEHDVADVCEARAQLGDGGTMPLR